LDEIDIESAAEEIRSLGDSQFQGARSQLRRTLMHMIKHEIQPERDGNSWRVSIVSARREIRDAIDWSPSIRRRLSDALVGVDVQALHDAGDETGIDARELRGECLFTFKELLDGDLAQFHF
jgi:hypothetical protein